LLVTILSLSGSDVQAQDDTVAKLYHRLLKSSLWIAMPDSTPRADGRPNWAHTGSGALIDLKSKLVLTNWHVVLDQDVVFVCFPTYVGSQLVSDKQFYLNVLWQGGGGRGKVIARDPKRDLALIQMQVIPQGALALPLAREGAKKGDRVHSIGNPGESDKLWVCTTRTVRDVTYQSRATGNDKIKVPIEAHIIITDTPGRPGESGGPLVNDRGELIGVAQSHDPENQEGCYIELREVKALLERERLPGKPTRPPAAKEAAKPPPDKNADNPPAKSADPEEEAARSLRFAMLLIDAGQNDRAKEVLQDIIEIYPRTATARQAQQVWEGLK
jgi:S1-C subfamily serine protease